MDGKGSSGFRGALVGIAAVLLFAYIVFITVKMARSDASRQTLLYLALALLAGVVAGAIGLLARRRHGRH